MPFSKRTALSQGEFIALIAMMFATIALSIDAMLPALPDIGAALSPEDPNQAQLIVSSFVLGMGVGTLFTGPLSDAFGRKTVLIAGSLLYAVAAVAALISPTLEMILFSRVLMGLGAAAPRIVGVAIVRDLYSGRDMARIMSLAMTIFMLVPAIAPAMGAGIIAISGWRAIFLVFAIFALIICLWSGLRLPEPLAQDARRPFRFGLMKEAFWEMMRHPTVRLSILAQTLCFGMLFTTIILVQPVYDIVFDRAETFPFWFGFVAIMSGSASILNARIVGRVGMRRVVTGALGAQALCSLAMLIATSIDLGSAEFYAFVAWQTSVFFMVGLTLGNLNSIAMEPLGHIAGMAASVIGAISTVLSTAIAAPIGLLFDGTLAPLVAGVLVTGFLAFLTMLWMARMEERTVTA